MCGGKGTRLDAPVEKPLFEVGGRPMVDRVRDALDASRIETTYVAVSPHVPDTRRHLNDVQQIRTAGEGYVSDLGAALDEVGTPVLTVAADLPLLDGAVVDRVLDAAAGSTSVRVPGALKQALGVTRDHADGWVPTGVNVVADDEDTVYRSYDARLAVNVNYRADAEVAERLLEPRTARGEGADGR